MPHPTRKRRPPASSFDDRQKRRTQSTEDISIEQNNNNQEPPQQPSHQNQQEVIEIIDDTSSSSGSSSQRRRGRRKDYANLHKNGNDGISDVKVKHNNDGSNDSANSSIDSHSNEEHTGASSTSQKLPISTMNSNNVPPPTQYPIPLPPMKPEAYYNQKINYDEKTGSNLAGVEPKLNMPVEIRDHDSIWSAAKIIDVKYDNSDSQSNSKAKSKGGRSKAKKNTTKDQNIDSKDDSSNATPQCQVTIRYEGWGSEWDETLPYPHPRLARLFTYTKKVKCFVDLLSKQKSIVVGKKPPRKKDANSSISAAVVEVKNWTDLWPCKVSFRMPHPIGDEEGDEAKSQKSQLLLRLENNVFVEPYAIECLPAYLRQGKNRMAHGGWWLNGNKLRLWRDLDVDSPIAFNSGGCVLCDYPSTTLGNIGGQSANPSSIASASNVTEYHVAKDFIKAYQTAKSDTWIRGMLPPKALLEGSLVVDWHRVRNIGGDEIDGVRYSGSFDPKVNYMNKGGGSSRGTSPIPPSFAQENPTLESATESSHATSQHQEALLKARPAPPPILPSPVVIKDVVYPDRGVKRLPHSNRWASTVCINGNDIFLGSFVSQTEAVRASDIALAHTDNDNDEGIDKAPDCEIRSCSPSYSTSTSMGNTITAPIMQDQLAIETIGKVTDMLSMPIESIVSAFEEKNRPLDSSRPQQVQQTQPHTSFRLHDWVMQNYKHAQYRRELAAAAVNVKRYGVGADANAGRSSDGAVAERREFHNDFSIAIGGKHVPTRRISHSNRRKQALPKKLNAVNYADPL